MIYKLQQPLNVFTLRFKLNCPFEDRGATSILEEFIHSRMPIREALKTRLSLVRVWCLCGL